MFKRPASASTLERIDDLRSELLGLVEGTLSPVAQHYGYSEIPLETHIKWRPIVLVLGNYSSGKSTLINELLGFQVQETGQAPTDDSFTVLTYDDDSSGPLRVTEERDGKVLLNDPQYPFLNLKKHGQRFAAHFRLKRVNSPFLRHLALIDTPGMLDSLAENDRGYDYQGVIGDLAQIADLVLVLFDPHKAGTIRESYASLRHTLPSRTFEDRVIFVMNRIDECENLNDLLRVYGTLCWNLSQMLGRKDIPQIRLTYANQAGSGSKPEYLKFLENQRQDLFKQISEAPRYRLDHLTAYAEMHAERLVQLLEVLVTYEQRRRQLRRKTLGKMLVLALLISLAVASGLYLQGPLAGSLDFAAWAALLTAGLILTPAYLFVWPRQMSRFHRFVCENIDQLTSLGAQNERDSWVLVRPFAQQYLERSVGKFSVRDLRRELDRVRLVLKKSTVDIREALSRLPGTS